MEPIKNSVITNIITRVNMKNTSRAAVPLMNNVRNILISSVDLMYTKPRNPNDNKVKITTTKTNK